ncbi:MAG TPA: class I SAM-dependent methyltransferase [Ktedonobacterales bacterium]|jgi:ubiquinone/menaquinone biosynthesis C-methylase UbiE
MRLFGWFRRSPQQAEASDGSASHSQGWLGGRRILTNTPYVMPKDKAEGDRLDLQHHLYKLLLGRNYFARLRQPREILDVACGTGIWCREMALEFKQAQVIGFDIDRTPMEASLARLGPGGMFPPNFTFLEADAFQRFPFEDEAFDFTHARAISPFVPMDRWPAVVAEMARVTRRGGYVELVDFDMSSASSQSQAFNTLWEAMQQLMAARGLHPGAAPYLARYLHEAGLAHVQERRALAGTGRQAQRQQRLLATDLLSILTNVQPIMARAQIMPEASYRQTLERARSETLRLNITQPVVFAFGQRL